ARDLLAACDRADRGKRSRQGHRHRHRPDRPDDEARASDSADRRGHPRRDDPQRLLRRFRVRHLWRYERIVLNPHTGLEPGGHVSFLPCLGSAWLGRTFRVSESVTRVRTPTCDVDEESVFYRWFTWASG